MYCCNWLIIIWKSQMLAMSDVAVIATEIQPTRRAAASGLRKYFHAGHNPKGGKQADSA
jgi:hypothetical protein